MPFQARFIKDGRVLLVRATGPADLKDWYDLPRRPELPGAGSGVGLLVDLRSRKTIPPPWVSRAIGEELREITAERFAAVALVARPGTQIGSVRTVDQLSAPETFPVRTFTELRPACEWLLTRLPPPEA